MCAYNVQTVIQTKCVYLLYCTQATLRRGAQYDQSSQAKGREHCEGAQEGHFETVVGAMH